MNITREQILIAIENAKGQHMRDWLLTDIPQQQNNTSPPYCHGYNQAVKDIMQNASDFLSRVSNEEA